MNLNVEVNPEEINKQITEAVAKSAIGVELSKTIEKKVKEMSASYNNPFDAIVKKEIEAIMTCIIRDEYKKQIQEQVRAKLSEKFVDEIISKMWDHVFDS